MGGSPVPWHGVSVSLGRASSRFCGGLEAQTFYCLLDRLNLLSVPFLPLEKNLCKSDRSSTEVEGKPHYSPRLTPWPPVSAVVSD